MIFLPLIIFVFGLLIGSFLNVVILRMNTGRSIVTGRSKCARCNHTLEWYELIPVFSFLGLRGKCRSCDEPISFQYPLVELTTAVVFVIEYSRIVVHGGFTTAAWISYAFALLVTGLLMVVLIYDLRHKIIPDVIVYPLMMLALAAILWRSVTIPGFSFGIALVEGVVVALPLFLIWFFSKGRVMGFGDVKLMLGIGWLVGLYAGVSVFLFSFWIGGIVGLFLLALTKRYGMKSEVAFGPFLIAALFIVAILGVTIKIILPI